MIHVTESLLNNLYEAQKQHLIHVLETNRNGDDGGDYISSALDVFAALQHMTQDQSDIRAAEAMLNASPDDDDVLNLANVAYEGICDAILRLNPPVLKEV